MHLVMAENPYIFHMFITNKSIRRGRTIWKDEQVTENKFSALSGKITKKSE